MRRNGIKLFYSLLVFPLLFGCAAEDNSNNGKALKKNEEAEAATASSLQRQPQAKAEVKDVHNNTVGTVHFVEQDNHILIKATIESLTPGHHGFHIHEKGVCDPKAPEGPFMTAGGHFNPTKGVHSGHAGDMPSLYVNKEGKATYFTTFDRVTLNDLTTKNLSVIIHENPDNFANIPARYQTGGKTGPDAETLKTGDAGKRQACGRITSSR
jgi:superoxide dismutase, Cu-Zn family